MQTFCKYIQELKILELQIANVPFWSALVNFPIIPSSQLRLSCQIQDYKAVESSMTRESWL